ncbi:MAG: hypothetical protein HYR66_15120 [Sphingobacteriales bacterium]|nr:hypothetical protein [Sphingobacteriales bacterium]MBI3718077.1 hypothetical protein [Sphingobacteriales bacterium]
MKPVLLLSCLIFSTGLTAQSPFLKNTIYIEAGGNGLFGSLNYERQLTSKPGIGIRAGIGFYTENAFYLTLPVGVNYLFPLNNKNSFIDAGMGITWSKVDGKIFGESKNTRANSFVNFIPSIGYRKHTVKDMMWRVSITPIINKNSFFPWAGISIGKIF